MEAKRPDEIPPEATQISWQPTQCYSPARIPEATVYLLQLAKYYEGADVIIAFDGELPLPCVCDTKGKPPPFEKIAREMMKARRSPPTALYFRWKDHNFGSLIVLRGTYGVVEYITDPTLDPHSELCHEACGLMHTFWVTRMSDQHLRN